MQYKSWIIIGTIYATLAQLCLTQDSPSRDDKIVSLPGQPQVSFRQYAGYVTIDEKQGRALFYYFVEAETEPASKPLVLWLNGGPGCSSIGAGAFSEHGPFRPSGTILVRNYYSWNKEANMLYLESPAGVGFSYSANKSFYASLNDKVTAQDNLVFLQRWLDKFPEYKGRDLFITGESYGRNLCRYKELVRIETITRLRQGENDEIGFLPGHYVPQLAQLVVQSNVKFSLKGIAVRNPLLEFDTDLNSRAEFLWSHGLISDSTYESFTSICNYSQIRRQLTRGSLPQPCSDVFNQVKSEMGGKSINAYDVSLDVCLSSLSSQSQMLNQLKDTERIDVCVEDETIQYLNRKDVQEAFHAQLVGLTRWTTCSNITQYDMQNLEVPTVHVLGALLTSGIRVLVYSGDQDSVVPLTGTRTLVNGLAKELGLPTVVPYRTWIEERQVAGWTQVYGDKLSFATIRGASHEAPFSQPKRSLGLFTAFLAGTPLPEAVS